MNDYMFVNDGMFAQNYNETENICVTKNSRQCFCITHEVTLWEKRLFGDRKICIVARRLFKDIWFIMTVSYG